MKAYLDLTNKKSDGGAASASKDLEERIGYSFNDPALLQEALTHPSAAGAGPDFERFEFLGDRVLGLVIADALVARYDKLEEGALARRLNALVRKEACAEVAQKIGLAKALRRDVKEARPGSKAMTALLGNGCEALIAAIYLDGGFEAAQRFVLQFWADLFEQVKEISADAKSALQEWAHQTAESLPDYDVIGRTGPDHAPIFTVSVVVKGYASVEASGSSKREAQQNAAEALLRREGVWS